MYKIAGMESTEINDPRSGKPIQVSTTVRIFYRKFVDSEKYGKMKNSKLNWLIAQDFAKNYNNVVHYFWISKERRIIAEIRSFDSKFFISLINDSSINLLTIQDKYFSSFKYKASSKPSDILEMGDE